MLRCCRVTPPCYASGSSGCPTPASPPSSTPSPAAGRRTSPPTRSARQTSRSSKRDPDGLKRLSKGLRWIAEPLEWISKPLSRWSVRSRIVVTHFGTGGPPAVVPLGELTETDAARITEALQKSRADNTRRAYRSTWRAWQEWAESHGHQPLPASTAGVAAYLAERAAHGAAAATLNAIRAGISATHRDHDLPDPTDNQGIQQMLKGLRREAAGKGRGQAEPLTVEDVAAIIATASIPRRSKRGMESPAQAQRRGAVDAAIVGLLFQGGLRRSEASVLTWADVPPATDADGLLVRVPALGSVDAAIAGAGRARAGARRPQRPVDRPPDRRNGQGSRHREADQRTQRQGGPRQRTHRQGGEHHRDDACWRLEDPSDGRPLQVPASPLSRVLSPSICEHVTDGTLESAPVARAGCCVWPAGWSAMGGG